MKAISDKVLFKILLLEQQYGGLWKAYEANKLPYSTYHRYHTLVLSGVVHTKENFEKFNNRA